MKIDTLLKVVKQLPLLCHRPDEVVMLQIVLIRYVTFYVFYLSMLIYGRCCCCYLFHAYFQSSFVLKWLNSAHSH